MFYIAMFERMDKITVVPDAPLCNLYQNSNADALYKTSK